MATTVNARDIALAATSPRITPVTLPSNVAVDYSTNVTGSTKPANNATVNRVTRSGTAPASPVDGDIWVDTSVTPNVIRTRVSGAWQASASYTTNTNQITDGANLGGTATWAGVTGATKPADYADVTTTILGASGTSIVMTNAQLFKSASGAAGVFIGSAGLFGKDSGGNTTFSISGTTGAATFAGALSAATGSFGAVTAGGAVTLNTTGSISNGISYGGTGIFLGYSGAAYKFSVGDAAKYLRWDGSTLTFTGALSAATGTFAGALSAATGTFAGALSAATGTFAGTLSAASITSGTLSASYVTGGTLSGTTLNIAGSGSAVIQAGPGSPYVYIGNLVANGYLEATATSSAKPAVRGDTTYNALAVHGSVGASQTGGAAHGVRGENGYTGATGLVGAANGYDFYADGAGTNYGPFTGAHDALVPIGAALEVGDIVCDVGVAVRKNVSNTLCFVSPSTAPAQGAAVGVVATAARSLNDGGHIPAALVDFRWTVTQPDGTPSTTEVPCRAFADLRLTHAVIAINALGEGQLNVCGEGGNLQPGDLITTSSTPGKGMRQADDLVRASSVAKCREAVVFDYPAQVKTVACIYLCG